MLFNWYIYLLQGEADGVKDSGITEKVQKGQLKLPNIKDCNSRIHHIKYGGHGYFFSWEHEVTKNLTVNWLTGRNICRRHCMDLVSLESEEEIEFLNNRIADGGTKFTWTSGENYSERIR